MKNEELKLFGWIFAFLRILEENGDLKITVVTRDREKINKFFFRSKNIFFLRFRLAKINQSTLGWVLPFLVDPTLKRRDPFKTFYKIQVRDLSGFDVLMVLFQKIPLDQKRVTVCTFRDVQSLVEKVFCAKISSSTSSSFVFAAILFFRSRIAYRDQPGKQFDEDWRIRVPEI